MTSTLILISIVLLVSSLCIGLKSGNDTINNFACRVDHKCGRHNHSYTWCYTDADNSWDYCCDTPCKYDDRYALTCKSGTYDKECGNPGKTTALRHTCRSSHQCGHHNWEYYWCYTDDNNHWDYCCHPGAPCSQRAKYKYPVCNTDLGKNTHNNWVQCAQTE